MLTILRFLLSPAHCYACKVLLPQHALVCDTCMHKIQAPVSEALAVTAQNTLKVFALSSYDEPLSTLIRAKNYHDHGAAVCIGKLMAEYARALPLDCDYIVPVPLHWTRRVWRGFNQAEVIADELAKVLNKPVVRAVYRTKRTLFQAVLDRGARYKNVEHVFSVAGTAEQMRGKKILIVDDLMTSGATLKAFSRALLAINPEHSIAFVAARVIQ